MGKTKKRKRKYEYKGKWKLFASAILVIVCVGMISGLFHGKPDTRVVAYLPYWSAETFDSEEAERITHLNMAFVNPDKSGNLSIDIPENELKKIIRKAHRHGVKVLMSMGGGNGYANYQALTSTKSGRKAFNSQIMDYVKEYRFDGIDLNIEGDVQPEFWDTYDSWVSMLRKSCDRKGLILTCSTASWFDRYISDKTFKYFDYISIMAYDNRSAHNHSSYEYAASQLKYFSDKRHIEEDKLVIGVPFYGYRYKNGACTGTTVTYGEVAKYNEDSQFVDESGTCRYNGIDTIKKKAELGSEYGGIMVWSLGQDATGRYSLLKAIAETLKN